MNEALQRAARCLQICDVFVRESSASLAEGFEPKYHGNLETLQMQFKHIVAHSEVLEIVNGEEPLRLFRVHMALGARWIEQPEDKKTDDPNAIDVKAKIEAIMVAEYEMEDDPGEEALNAFALIHTAPDSVTLTSIPSRWP